MTSRVVITMFLAGALAVGTAACGGDAAEPAAGKPSPSAPAGEPISVGEPLIEESAVQAFGQDKAKAAYQQVVEFSRRYAFNPELLRPRTFTAADFAGPRDYMSDSAQKRWDEVVAKALRGDKEAGRALQGAALYNLRGTGIQLAGDGPLVVNHALTNGRVAADPKHRGAVTVSVVERADIRLALNGVPGRMPVTKQVTYRLVPRAGEGAGQWVLDGWQVSTVSRKHIPD